MFNGNANFIPFVKQAWGLLFKMIPEIPRKCPFPAGEYRFVNKTIMSRELLQSWKNLISFMTLSATNLPPNGVYRIFYRFYSDEDSVGVVIYFDIEVNARLNEDRF